MDLTDKTNAFTLRIPGQLADIRSYVVVANPDHKESKFGTMAVWDTGSPICFISEKLMKLLGLEFDSEISGHGFFGSGSTVFGTVSLRLVSGGRFIDIKAAVVPDIHRGAKCQMLIGMNVIGKGQFSLSFKDGYSTFSFAIPAVDSGDLVDSAVEKDVPVDFDYIDLAEVLKDGDAKPPQKEDM